MDETAKAMRLIRQLSAGELDALRSLAQGDSARMLAARLATDLASAAELKNAMKRKLGVERDADAVRVASYAGLCD